MFLEFRAIAWFFEKAGRSPLLQQKQDFGLNQMTKLLILDKDGTLVRPKSGQTFVQSPEDQELIEGVQEAIARYVGDGWQIAIASNQGGVAAGHKTLEEAIDEMIFACDLIKCETALFAHSYEPKYGECVWVDMTDDGMYWKIITNAKRKFRKPHTGMIDWLASNCLGTHLWRGELEVLFVGDRPEDEECAKSAGVRFMWAEEWLKEGAIAQ